MDEKDQRDPGSEGTAGPDPGIEALRGDIRDIDARVVELVSQRLLKAMEIGRIKSGLGIPLRDFGVEREVVGRLERECAKRGLPPAMGKRLATFLIRESIRSQSAIKDGSFGGTRKRILVIGGAGRMGRWFVRFFHSQGHKVSVLDPGGEVTGFSRVDDLASGVAGSDVVMLATPLAASRDALREVIGLDPKGLVFDICSLKTHIIDVIGEGIGRGVRMSSIHPMFGPDVDMLTGRNVLVLGCGCPGADEEVRSFFSETNASVIEMDVNEHDRLMAHVLGASHALNIVFSNMLAKCGFSFGELLDVASSTFMKQIATTREVASENPRLYYEIQALNSHSPEVYEGLERSLVELRETMGREDIDSFVRMMEESREYFARAHAGQEGPDVIISDSRDERGDRVWES